MFSQYRVEQLLLFPEDNVWLEETGEKDQAANAWNCWEMWMGKRGNLLKKKKKNQGSLRINPCDKCLDQLEREREREMCWENYWTRNCGRSEKSQMQWMEWNPSDLSGQSMWLGWWKTDQRGLFWTAIIRSFNPQANEERGKIILSKT